MNRFLAFLVALLLVSPLSAKEGSLEKRASLAAPAFATINGTPLRINIGADNSYQIFNSVVGGAGQFFPSGNLQTGDSGWFVRVGTTLYAPNFGEHPGGSATGGLGATTDVTEVSLGAVSGNGSRESPFTVTVTTRLGGSGLTATKSTTYVNGDGYYTERFRLSSSSPNTLQVKVFLGSDIYLANSDDGVPYRESVSGSPGGRTCPGVAPEYTILHIPLTRATSYTAAEYSSVWQQIGAGSLNNTIGADCIDNGAALQWDVTIPSNGSSTILAATSFGPIPPVAQFNINDVNPALGAVGTSVNVVISGFGFQQGTTFNFGSGITVSSVIISNSTTASATLLIASNAPFGGRDVVATQNPGGISATLINGFAVTDVPGWNYSVTATPGVSQPAVTCVRAKFPATASNAQDWAPTEGEFYHEVPGSPGNITGPVGLAKAILDCFLSGFVWNAEGNQLQPNWCWDGASPQYLGEYPETRRANLRVYMANNLVCGEVLPGATVYEFEVSVSRQPFLMLPLLQNGFEDR